MNLSFLQWSNWFKFFYAKLLKIEKKKDYNKINTYYIGYVTVKKNDNCNNIKSVNSLYLMIAKIIGHLECNYVWK